MGHGNVRMGKRPAGVPWRWLLIGGLVAVIACALAFALWPEEARPVQQQTGCNSDADCKPGTSCVGRGCLILLSAENPVLWREDVTAQLDPQLPWKPRSKFGEKMVPATKCPAPPGKGIKPDESRTTRVHKITVYEIGGQQLRIHQQIKAKGNLWLDSLRLWFPTLRRVSPNQVCVSPDVDSVIVGSGRWRGRNAQRVDLRLKRAVPAGTVGGAAINVEGPLPDIAPDGFRTLEFGLDPVFESTAAESTVVALPLGADVATIDGPPPNDQRLLTGYVAYYWKHGKAASELAIRFRVPEREHRALALEELNP